MSIDGPLKDPYLNSLRKYSVSLEISLSLEEKMASDELIKFEQLFSSLLKADSKIYRYYEDILNFSHKLFSIDGLFERFMKKSPKDQLRLYRECFECSIVLNELLLNFEKINCKEVVFFKSLPASEVRNFLKKYGFSEYIPKEIFQEFASTNYRLKNSSKDAVFTVLVLLYVTKNKSELLDLVERHRREPIFDSFDAFLKLLNNWPEFRNYPLEWSVELVNTN